MDCKEPMRGTNQNDVKGTVTRDYGCKNKNVELLTMTLRQDDAADQFTVYEGYKIPYLQARRDGICETQLLTFIKIHISLDITMILTSVVYGTISVQYYDVTGIKTFKR